MRQLREEAKEEAIQSANLALDLKKAQAEVERLEADLHSQRRANIELISLRNQARTQLEVASEEKAVELESALAK